MINKKNKAFLIFYFLFGLIVFLPPAAYADCTHPASPKGGFAYFAEPDKTYRYCDGENWVDFTREDSPDDSGRVDVVLPSYSDIAVPELATPDALMKLRALTNEPERGAP